MHDHYRVPVRARPKLRPNRARSAFAQVLNTVFQGRWVGQQCFTSTAEIDALHAALQLSPGAHALDIGCGTGGPAIYLAQQIGCRVTGVGATPRQRAQAVAAAATLANQVRFIGGDIFTARLAANSFDGIISRDAFVTVADKARLLRTCRWLLRPGRRMACTVIVERGTRIERPGTASLLPWPLPTIEDYHALAQHAGLHLLASDDLSATFCEVGARWRGALSAWEHDLRSELGTERLGTLQASIGQLAEWASQGRLGHIRLVFLRE